MRRRLLPLIVALSLLLPALAQGATSGSSQCSVATAKIASCLKTKFGACKGKSGNALLECVRSGAGSSAACDTASLSACVSPSCKQAVTGLTQCGSILKQSCKGLPGSELTSCLRKTLANTAVCNPAKALTCVASTGTSTARPSRRGGY